MKRRCLALSERDDVIHRSEKSESARAIALKLGVGKTQIQNVLKNKDKIMESFSSGSAAGTKSLSDRTAKYADVNSAMWDWFTKARSRRLTITGPLLEEKARALAVALGHTQFAASNGRKGTASSLLF